LLYHKLYIPLEVESNNYRTKYNMVKPLQDYLLTLCSDCPEGLIQPEIKHQRLQQDKQIRYKHVQLAICAALPWLG
jgi:hypothetical protein